MENKREWVSIKGRKLLWTEFIYVLDDYRHRRIVWEKGEDISNKYNHMICVLQELTDDYHQGKDYITDQSQDLFERYYMKMPEERKLPEALDELFEQLQTNLGIDLTELLDLCVQKTESAYQCMQKEEQIEAERVAVVRSLLSGNWDNVNQEQEVEEKIYGLLRLQKAKWQSPDYELNKKEIGITGAWCDLLISSRFFDTITYGQMRRLIENDLIYESEISELLQDKYHMKEDYEWYDEDFLGCGLDEPTIIKIEDIFSLCEIRVKKAIGIKDNTDSDI